MSVPKRGKCRFCQRRCHLSFHHLIPKKLHRRPFFKKHYTREQLNDGVMMCRQCHNGVHRFYDEMTLAKRLNTVDALSSDPDLARHFEWVARQKIRI